MRQNADPILALAEFKRVISVIKYQEFMPDPFDFDALDFRYIKLFFDRIHKVSRMKCLFPLRQAQKRFPSRHIH